MLIILQTTASPAILSLLINLVLVVVGISLLVLLLSMIIITIVRQKQIILTCHTDHLAQECQDLIKDDIQQEETEMDENQTNEPHRVLNYLFTYMTSFLKILYAPFRHISNQQIFYAQQYIEVI